MLLAGGCGRFGGEPEKFDDDLKQQKNDHPYCINQVKIDQIQTLKFRMDTKAPNSAPSALMADPL